jgi:hypothetical protein
MFSFHPVAMIRFQVLAAIIVATAARLTQTYGVRVTCGVAF